MTTTTINTWKELWNEFYNGVSQKEWNKEKLSVKDNNFLKMLDYTNEHIDEIFSKLDELRMMLPHMAEVIHVLHNSMTNDNYDFEYRSLGFEITINEHIQICVEPQEETDAVTEIECKVEFENERLSFMIDEHDHEELQVYTEQHPHVIKLVDLSPVMFNRVLDI